MDIESGAEVIDKNGLLIGTVNRIIVDSWTGEIRKFTVSSSLSDGELFYAPEDVLRAGEKRVRLKVAFDSPADVKLQFGSRVIDKNGRMLGTVDYLVSDTYTGDIIRFRVDDGSVEGISFSMEDVLSVTATEVRLKVTSEEV